MRLSIAFAISLLIAAPAQARWYEASSDHFVIYADDSEKDVARFTEMLESYHSAMEFLTGVDVEKPSPSSRVTIYAVGNQRAIRDLYGAGRDSAVAGFYDARASGSVAFVPNIRIDYRNPDFSMTVLLHEYAHHFLIGSSRFESPRWLDEGAAEFFASARFGKDGTVEIGRPAYHRAGELAYAADVPIRHLLDEELYRENVGKRYTAFYGRAWLLYHYMQFEPTRRGQVRDYMHRLMAKASPIEAAEQAFGNLDTLEKDLDRYLVRNRMSQWALGPERLSRSDVRIRELSKGHAEMMPVIIRSRRGVTPEQAEELLPEAREIALRHPDDADVLSALAEAEFDAGNDAEAIAAAKAAIAIDPDAKNAYVQWGYALFRMAETADDPIAAYRAAMAPFSALNERENDHPLPLIYYYRSFIESGRTPNENARHALERATELAPFDKGLWLQAGRMFADEGKIALARYALAPLAASPHGGKMAESAQEMIDALDGAVEGERFLFLTVAVEDEAVAGVGGGLRR